MRGNRKVDTKPEVELRRRLHAAGARFRKHHLIEWKGGRVRADIAFPRRRVAVFVDGCFWHMCPDHGTQPGSNVSYWAPKLARNVTRDRVVTCGLETADWTVVRVWEHTPVDEAALIVVKALRLDGTG
jgi:DNA mismatch endonuclease (patch repair protein)